MSDEVYPAFAAVLGGQKPTIKVRDMTSRWGVCVPAKQQITFALQLYNMPAAAQIYVVVHEYCHFLCPITAWPSGRRWSTFCRTGKLGGCY